MARSLMDYLLERIDPNNHLRSRQDVQQIIDTLSLEERFDTFEAVLSKALLHCPWVMTRWDMEIFRLAKQLKLKDVAKKNIEKLLHYSEDHTVIDLDTDSIYMQLKEEHKHDICFQVSHIGNHAIEFFNEELDFSSTVRGALDKHETYLGQIGLPLERINSVFEEEEEYQVTYFTSTRVTEEVTICGFVFMELGSIVYHLRGPLVSRSVEKKDVLISTDYGVSFISKDKRAKYGDGDYKFKVDGGDPPSHILLSDLLEARKIAICLPKRISSGVFSQNEIRMKVMTGKAFLSELRFKVVDKANSWPPNQSIIDSKLTLEKNGEGVIKNHLMDLKISLINNSQVRNANQLEEYLRNMQAENDTTIISQTQNQGIFENMIGYTKQIPLFGKATPTTQQQKSEKRKFVTLTELNRRDFSVLIDFDSLDFVIDGSDITIPFISMDTYILVLYRQFIGVDSKMTSTINSMRLLLADINSMKTYCEMTGTSVKTLNDIFRLIPKNKEDVLVAPGYERIVTQANSRRRAVLRDCSNQSRYNPVTWSISVFAAIFATLSLIQVLQAAALIPQKPQPSDSGSP